MNNLAMNANTLRTLWINLTNDVRHKITMILLYHTPRELSIFFQKKSNGIKWLVIVSSYRERCIIMLEKERIRKVRQTLGLTQTEFGKRIAISKSYIAGMELGDKKVNDRAIRLISMEYNINEHWLRTGEGSMYNESADVAIAKMNSLFKSLDPASQECALAQLNVLVDYINLTKAKTPD